MRLPAALADRYRIARELGAGGMATVYLAHDVRHERDVAKDGARFLMIESEFSGLGIVAVPNWRTELRRLTGTAKP